MIYGVIIFLFVYLIILEIYMHIIKFVVFDFDGVFTNKIYISSKGVITKSVNPKETNDDKDNG